MIFKVLSRKEIRLLEIVTAVAAKVVNLSTVAGLCVPYPTMV